MQLVDISSYQHHTESCWFKTLFSLGATTRYEDAGRAKM